MIEVRFYQKPEKGSIHMVMKGHSDAAPRGEDLVCAGATTLAYTLAQAVQFLEDKLAIPPKIEIGEGHARIIATPKEEGLAEVLYAFWFMQCGIHVLCHNYPGRIRLDHFRDVKEMNS